MDIAIFPMQKTQNGVSDNCQSRHFILKSLYDRIIYAVSALLHALL